MNWLAAFILAVSLSQCAGPAPAESAPAATLLELEGTVQVFRANTPDPLEGEEDMDLFQGDRITTGATSACTISFLDNHFVKLHERATLTITRVKANPNSGTMWARLALAAGKLLASFAGGGAGSGMEIETPTAIAAVRGTTFQVEVDQTASTVSVLEGSVLATSLREGGGAGEAVQVDEGRETAIDRRTRRFSSMRSLARNERRRAMRVGMSEFRARTMRYREQARSGEMGRMRGLRTLARTYFIIQLRQKYPARFDALPAWRKERVERFLRANGPRLEQRKEEVQRFLSRSPKTRERLQKEAMRWLAAPPGRRPSQRMDGARQGGGSASGRGTRRTGATQPTRRR